MIKIRCKNLFCDVADREIDDTREHFNVIYEEVVCPFCGFKGAIPDSHVLKTKEITRQIWFFSDKVLFRDLFKRINFSKLPKNMVVQNVCSKEKK